MYKIKVNERHDFEIEFSEKKITLGKEEVQWDIVELKSGHFHILKDNSSYSAEVVEANAKEKTFTIKVNGNQYTVLVKDRFDQLLKQLGMEAASQKVNDIKAPMPGMVLDVKVQPGQALQKGDSVVVLEAMKMENVLKSPGEGIVKEVTVISGDKVEKNQVLVVLE